ncbi:hypothetical protein MXB_3373 [Myxobolus squamalis]|nr:hypothetical protein MXB_3373 [Myxobolus squamalis]
MIDAAPDHMTDHTEIRFINTNTMLAMIPGILTKKLQVLDISVSKLFISNLKKFCKNWMIKGFKDYLSLSGLRILQPTNTADFSIIKAMKERTKKKKRITNRLKTLRLA